MINAAGRIERYDVPPFVDDWLQRAHGVSRDGAGRSTRSGLSSIKPRLMRDRSRSSFTNRTSVCVWVSIVSSSSTVVGIPVALPQQIDGVRNRRQRVSQLMPQRGDELILALAAGDEPRHHVRASGDVLDCEQQLFAAIRNRRGFSSRSATIPVAGSEGDPT